MSARTLGAFLIGLVAGAIGSMLGVGGGLVMTPAFVLFLRLSLPEAIGTSLCVIPFLAAVAVATEAWLAPHHLHFDVALLLCAGGIPGTWLGFLLVRQLPVRILGRCFAVFLLVAAAYVLQQVPWQGFGRAPAIAFVLCGLLAGIASAMFGVGGGIVAVPSLLLLRDDLGFLPARATSLIMVTVLAASGALWFSRARLSRGRHAAAALPGAVLGSFLGVRAVQHVPEDPLRWAFAVALCWTSWRVLRRVR